MLCFEHKKNLLIKLTKFLKFLMSPYVHSIHKVLRYVRFRVLDIGIYASGKNVICIFSEFVIKPRILTSITFQTPVMVILCRYCIKHDRINTFTMGRKYSASVVLCRWVCYSQTASNRTQGTYFYAVSDLKSCPLFISWQCQQMMSLYGSWHVGYHDNQNIFSSNGGGVISEKNFFTIIRFIHGQISQHRVFQIVIFFQTLLKTSCWCEFICMDWKWDRFWSHVFHQPELPLPCIRWDNQKHAVTYKTLLTEHA